MVTVPESKIVVLHGASRKRKVVGWYSLCLAACAYGIVWSVVTWSGPNLRFSFLDPNMHHATRVINIAVLLVASLEIVTMMRLAVGWAPTAVVRVSESGDVEVAATQWLPGLPQRVKRLTGPVEVEYRFYQGDRRTVSRWDLFLKGKSAKTRVGTLWPLREEDVEALRAQIRSTL